MTVDTHAEAPTQHRRSRRLRDFLQKVASALLAPVMVVSAPLVDLLAGQRRRADRRLVAGSRTPSRHARIGDAAKREALFSIVRIEPDFSPRTYASTFAALQLPPSAKLLDLVPARLLCDDVFERLAAAWSGGPHTVPRLGILLSFERWVTLRGAALAALQPLTARGIRVEVFYEEQASAGHLGAWFAYGQVVHTPSAVAATLAARWQPSASWPSVIEALTRLVRAYSCATELPALLTEIAGLALSCGGADEAAMLARAALYDLPETPSPTRSKALRELGAALIGQGQTAAGLALLDQATIMAKTVKAPAIAGDALCQSALSALNRGDYASAEGRFREAIALLSSLPQRSHLLAQAHHHLAIALMHRHSDEAEHHARAALALRTDPFAHLAEEDRSLLAKLRELGIDVRIMGSSATPLPHAAETDV